ncbi:MAG: hypothetical protein J6Y53_01490 [Alphaproteobacteria bacterium]|nr:hypothetical protein [Alphaproteobacteria bacterium]
MKKKTTAKQNICTPTWLQIAEQIDDSRDQVFRTAVLNLTKIALSCQNYRNNILELLQQTLCSQSSDETRKEYLAKKIAEIENKK